MDLQRSYQAYSATEADVKGAVLHRLPRYAVCVGLGLLGGAVGVALAIGLAITIQLRLPPPTVFTPGVMPLIVTAVLAGLCASWLMGQAARYGLPDLLDDPSHNGTQVILVSSVFASLAQVLFFFV
jgi:F0F1-type ATP synthase membrane subunit c/vacuolar-type H+-ATPase subunit K